MKYRIKIRDQEPLFEKRLSDYIQSQYNDLFQVFYGEVEQDQEVWILSLAELQGEDGIFKYQSAGQIVQELLWSMKDEAPRKANTKPVKVTLLIADQNLQPLERKRIFRIFKEDFPEEKILYLNFSKRGYLARSQCSCKKRDILDLIYTARYHSELFWNRFSGCIIEKEEMSCLLPPLHLWNCMAVEEEAYRCFFQKMESQNTYQRIIVDMDEMLPFYSYILARMTDCYCLYENEEMKLQRQKEMEEILELLGVSEKLNQCYFVSGR